MPGILAIVLHMRRKLVDVTFYQVNAPTIIFVKTGSREAEIMAKDNTSYTFSGTGQMEKRGFNRLYRHMVSFGKFQANLFAQLRKDANS